MPITIATLNGLNKHLVKIQGPTTRAINWRNVFAVLLTNYKAHKPARDGDVNAFLLSLRDFNDALSCDAAKNPSPGNLALLNIRFQSLMKEACFIRHLLRSSEIDLLNRVNDEYRKWIAQMREEGCRENELLRAKVEILEEQLKHYPPELNPAAPAIEMNVEVAAVFELESRYQQALGRLQALRRLLLHQEKNHIPADKSLPYVKDSLLEVQNFLQQKEVVEQADEKPAATIRLNGASAAVCPALGQKLLLNVYQLRNISRLLSFVDLGHHYDQVGAILNFSTRLLNFFSFKKPYVQEVRDFLIKLEEFRKKLASPEGGMDLVGLNDELDAIMKNLDLVKGYLRWRESTILQSSRWLYENTHTEVQIARNAKDKSLLRETIQNKSGLLEKISRVAHQQDLAQGVCEKLSEGIRPYKQNESYFSHMCQCLDEIRRVFGFNASAEVTLKRIGTILDAILHRKPQASVSLAASRSALWPAASEARKTASAGPSSAPSPGSPVRYG